MKKISRPVHYSGLLHVVFSLIITYNTLHAQWMQTNLDSVNIGPFAVSGTNLFAGGWLIGVYRSTDNGTNWIAVDSGLYGNEVMALALSGGNLYAGTWGWTGLSTNNGTSWTGLPGNYICSFAFTPNGTGGWNIFVGNYMGDICMLTNNGSTWTTIDTCAFYAGVHTLVVCPNGAGGSNIFAGSWGSGVLLSTDNGTSWAAVDSGLTSTWIGDLAIFPNGVGGSESFCRSRWRCLSFHKQRNELETSQYRLDEYLHRCFCCLW